MYFELTTNESQKLINIIMIYKNIIDELQIQKKVFRYRDTVYLQIFVYILNVNKFKGNSKQIYEKLLKSEPSKPNEKQLNMNTKFEILCTVIFNTYYLNSN